MTSVGSIKHRNKDHEVNGLSLEQVARFLGGRVSGGCVRAPGPGHSARDDSLSFKFEAGAPDGFLVHSFAGDDPIVCKDFVRQKLGLSSWESKDRGADEAKNVEALMKTVSDCSR
ncbi:MAG: hypothetical protein WB662_09260 [Methyloceanibacter sp.]|jgi:hypothetical protein